MSARARRLAGLAAVAGAALVAQEFYSAGLFYGDYWQPSEGVVSVPWRELTFDALYTAYGIACVLLLSLGLHWLGFSRALASAARGAVRNRRLPYYLAALAVAISLLVRFAVLDRMVVTDDEETYLFIARTLLKGRLTNPVPVDPDFIRNQFVLINSHGWFGKYPIGHGLVLAVGLLTRSTDFILCLLGGLTVLATWQIGVRTIGRRRALLAAALLALSPHFTWTHATLLSQPTTCAALMWGSLALLRWRQSGRSLWAWLAGAALAFGCLARPLPGGLFIVSGAAVILAAPRAWRERWRAMVPLAVLAAACALVFALTHLAQSGEALRSGYHEAHGGLGVVANASKGAIGLSLIGGLWRENFWLFGWPLSLLPIAFARPKRGRMLLWAPIAGVLAYRILIPKTVVSTTGPTYLLEAVPMFALLAADGLARLQRILARARIANFVPVALPAATLAALIIFWPIEALSVSRGAAERREVWDLLAEARAAHPVVFSNILVIPRDSYNWAYAPPNPSPDLDDDVLFLRVPLGERVGRRVYAFAQKHFPQRPAFLFSPYPQPILMPINSETAEQLGWFNGIPNEPTR